MEEQPERAAAMLAPASAGRHGNVVTFGVGRGGVGSSPDLIARLLARLDAERIHGVLAPVKVEEAAAAGARSRRVPLGEQWEQAQTSLPADWSDLYGEIELDSSDYLERGALLLAPVNPGRVKGRLALPVPRRAALRLRRVGRDDGALPPAPGRRGNHRQLPRPVGALRHQAGLHAGPGLVRRRPRRLMADPVSWYLIEQGWEVVGSDGEAIGKVEETVGDSTHDIFDGLTVGTGLLSRPRYVPAELVGEIVEGRVALTIDKERFERLDEYQEPPTTEEIEAP